MPRSPGLVADRIGEDEAGDSIATFIRIMPRRGGRARTITLPNGLCWPNNLSWSLRSAR